MTLREAAPEPILIEDHSFNNNLWANDVGISDYKVIAGSYAVYHIVLLTRSGSRVDIWKRYREFEQLRQLLVLAKPLINVENIPPKSIFNRLDNAFLESRRRGLDYFLKSVVLHPELCDVEGVKRFFMNSAG